jgi:MraZ protein
MAEAERAKTRGMTSKTGRDYARMLFASAEQGVPDKQGRISLTPSLREYAALTRDVVVIGAMDRVEIWEPTRWREYSASAQEKFAELDEERLTD